MTNAELHVLLNAALAQLKTLDLPTTNLTGNTQRQTIQVQSDLARMAADCLYLIKQRNELIE